MKKEITISYDTTPTDMVFMLESLFNDLGIESKIIEDECSTSFAYDAYQYWRGSGDPKPSSSTTCESKTTFGNWVRCYESPETWGRMKSETDLCDEIYRWRV